LSFKKNTSIKVLNYPQYFLKHDFENELEEFENSFEQEEIMNIIFFIFFTFPHFCVFFQCLKIKITSLKTRMWKPPLNTNMSKDPKL
jgi:hypothetical protein